MWKTICRGNLHTFLHKDERTPQLYKTNLSQYDEPTGRHFNLPNHNVNDFNCKIIQIMGTKPKRFDPQRIEKEECWIDQLKTRTPQGLNDTVGRQKVRT